MPKLAVYQDDDLYLIMRGTRYYLHGTVNGHRVRMACGTSDLVKAKLVLENVKRQHDSGWREQYALSDRDWKTVADMMHDRQKRNAVKRGISFELRPAEVFGLMKSTGFLCAVSGIPFSKRFADYGKRDPWAPSIDRIENRQGYTVENCRVVCLAANIAMSDWGMDVLLRLTRGVHRSSLTLADELTPDWHKSNTEDDKPLIHLVNLT
jgi:hypothetical protein